MTKAKATKLEKIINYFANEWPTNVWEAKMQIHFEKEWEVRVYLNNNAYRHELNALMMLVNSNVTVAVYQEVDNNKKIFWRIW